MYRGYTLQLLTTNSSPITISASEKHHRTRRLFATICRFHNNTYVNLQALSAAGPSMDTSGPLVSDTTITRIQRTFKTI